MDTTKIIKGVVSNGRYTVTAPIVKEDYGLYLQIEGVELPETYQVDFSNDEHNGTSVTMIGNADGVLIPRQFIDSGKDVFAFLYHVGTDFGRTVYKFRIPNKVRPNRTNEQPTPEEQSVIDQSIAALNEAVEQTAQDKADADASAQSAKDDADMAEQARDDAQTYANNASASASASAQSASQSAQIKSDVEDLAEDAQEYADSARQSASQASASEQGCARAVLDAASAVAIARARAEEASGYAQTASAKAQDASTSAQTASQKATESAQSASQTLSYKTDAESAKTASQTAQGLAEQARNEAVSAKTDAESAKADAESARDEAQQAVASISGALDDKADVITDTASGAVASFSDGADGLPLKSLVVDINPIQDTSSGDPSPENICPISGWEGVNISATKKNLCNAVQSNVLEYSSSYSQYTLTDGTVTTSGNALMGFIIPVKPSTTYAYSFTKTTGNSLQARVRLFSGYPTSFSDNYISQPINTFVSQTATSASVTFTTTADTRYVMVGMYVTGESVAINNFQVEFGSTATPYEPYNGTTLPINWQTEAGTVYGGKLDVLTGILTVYPYYASYNGETLTGRWISDRDVYAVGTTPTIGAQVVNVGAEGTEIQLEPHEVASLLGQNNIFANTGDCSVEYRANTKLWVQKKIAEAISALS